MSDAPKITVDFLLANPPGYVSPVMREFMAEQIRKTNEAAEAEGRRTMAMAAHYFACSRADRHRLDPRRLGDRYAEAACRRSVQRSKTLAAARLAKLADATGGAVVYRAAEPG